MVNEMKAVDWDRVISQLKKEYTDLHVFYSSADGWANLSYKRKFEKIKSNMTETEIRIIVAKMFDENIF